MLFYKPDSIPETYYSGLDLYLWIASVLLCFILAIFFFIAAKKISDIKSNRAMMNSFALFYVFMMLNKIAFFLSYFTAYYAEFLAVGYITATLSLFPLVYSYEKYLVQKTHFLFSIAIFFIIIFTSLVFIFPEELEQIRNTTIMLSFIPMAIILFIWLLAIKLTFGVLRKRAIWTLVGFACILAGYMLDSEMIITMRIIPDEIAPILFNIGLIVTCLAQLFKKE